MTLETRPVRFAAAVLTLFLLAVAGAQGAPQEAAQAQGDTWADEMAAFEAFVESYMEATGMPGLSVAVMKGDWVWSKGFGWADVENRSPARPESAYRLASVTKPMTAVAVVKLAEDGKLDLDAEIQTYVPHFPKKEHPITARQLLGHLGGVSHYQNYDLEGHFKDHKTTAEAIAVFADFDLVAEPGTEYNYTSYGYNLLGAAIEGASGMSYGDYMTETIWRPMGMDDTRMDDPYELIPNRVRGYRIQNGRLENSEFVDISSRFAAGGTRSTVLDLVSFAQGLAANTVLTPASTELMLTSLATREGRYTDYAMGWGVSPINGRPRVTHSGGQDETRTQLTWFPADDFAIAMASNLEGADFQPLHEKLLRLFFDETWNVLAFLPDERERAIYNAIAGAYRHGLADHRLNGGDGKVTPRVEAAFRSFREATSAKAHEKDPDSTLETLRNGRHPAGDRAWVAMGSYMATTLTGGDPGASAALHHGGELGFFKAYIDHYRANRRRIPRKLRFSKELEGTIAAWAADWEAVWTPELRGLILSEAVDPEELQRTLRAAFDGRTLVPDYSPELMGFAETAFQRGQQSVGLAMAQLGMELYPEAENTNGLWGVVLITAAQLEQGKRHLKKAAAIDPEGYAGVGNLTGIAQYFAGANMAPAAKALLEVAAEIHPDSEQVREALAALE